MHYVISSYLSLMLSYFIIQTGHRFRPIHDFGYVALDIIDVIEEDTGTYTCRAVNLLGVDETSCHLTCRST